MARVHTLPRRSYWTSNVPEHSTLSVRTHAGMTSSKWRMTTGIVGGTPWKTRSAHGKLHSGVKGIGVVDKTYEQRGVIFTGQFVQATHHEHDVSRPALRAERTSLFRQVPLSFAVIADATSDHLPGICLLVDAVVAIHSGLLCARFSAARKSAYNRLLWNI